MIWTVWDEINGEPEDARRIEATSSERAALQYAEDDHDGHIDGLYQRSHPILVRGPDGSLRRHQVVAERVLHYHAVQEDLVRPGWKVVPDSPPAGVSIPATVPTTRVRDEAALVDQVERELLELQKQGETHLRVYWPDGARDSTMMLIGGLLERGYRVTAWMGKRPVEVCEVVSVLTHELVVWPRSETVTRWAAQNAHRQRVNLKHLLMDPVRTGLTSRELVVWARDQRVSAAAAREGYSWEANAHLAAVRASADVQTARGLYRGDEA